MKGKVLTAAVGAAMLALSGCGSAQHHVTSQPSASATAASQSTPPPPSPFDVWWDSRDSQHFLATQTDIVNIQKDANNGDITDLDIEAHKLFSDAVAAGHHPCPVDRRIFLNAMADYGVAAGYIFEYANYSKAGKLIRRGNALINRITDITSEVSG